MPKLTWRIRANIQVNAFVDLYAMRVREPSLKIPAGMDTSLSEIGGTAARSIEQSIRSFQIGEDTQHHQQKIRLATAAIKDH